MQSLRYAYLIYSANDIKDSTIHMSLKSLRNHCKRLGLSLKSIPKLYTPILFPKITIIKIHCVNLTK